LHSFCVIPTRHVPSLAETIRAIIAWWRGVHPNWRERAKEAQMVAEIAKELDAASDESHRLSQRGLLGKTAHC
jgi:hypothetical protein